MLSKLGARPYLESSEAIEDFLIENRLILLLALLDAHGLDDLFATAANLPTPGVELYLSIIFRHLDLHYEIVVYFFLQINVD